MLKAWATDREGSSFFVGVWPEEDLRTPPFLRVVKTYPRVAVWRYTPSEGGKMQVTLEHLYVDGKEMKEP